jgi:hypothetical protein
MDRQLREITTDPVRVRTADLAGGLYLLQLRIGDQILTKQIVVQGR